MPNETSEKIPNVALELIPRNAKAALKNLFQLYIHDFTELWAGEPRGDIGEDGLFAEDMVDQYWTDADATLMFIRADAALAGFALVDRTSHSGAALDWNVAEFFVLRKYRKARVGRRAAHAVFARFSPGVWEAAVSQQNVAAFHFWRNAIAAYDSAHEIEEIAGDDQRWRGPIFRFRTV